MRNDAGLSGQSEAGWIDYLTEVLRYDPPVQNTRRFAKQDINLDGEFVQAGDAILVVLAAANRDPQLNVDPDNFRCDRPAANILTFGQGAHACPGQGIALKIAASALSTLRPTWRERSATRNMIDAVVYRSLPNVRIPTFAS
jgi:cytochrome P450